MSYDTVSLIYSFGTIHKKSRFCYMSRCQGKLSSCPTVLATPTFRKFMKCKIKLKSIYGNAELVIYFDNLKTKILVLPLTCSLHGGSNAHYIYIFQSKILKYGKYEKTMKSCSFLDFSNFPIR